MRRKSDQGSVILVVSMIAAAASIAIFAYSSLFSANRKVTINEEQRFEVSLLTRNILEFGKYLMLYEKVFYLDKPDSQDASLKTLWGMGISSEEMHQACGGYDLVGGYEGVHQLGGRKIFCPFMLRFATMSSAELEQRYLDLYSSPGNNQVLSKIREGVYRLEFDLTNRLAADAGDFFDFFSGAVSGSKLADGTYRNKVHLKATLSIDILTDAAGFVPANSERYFRFQATVALDGAPVPVSEEESLMVVLTTPRDFALFMPYGYHATTYATTNSFFGSDANSSAIRLHSSAQVRGRAYFNGNISRDQTDLSGLPTFLDSVVLSGNLLKTSGSGSVIPNADDIAVLQQKFRKGFVTHFSAARYLMDGFSISNGICSGAISDPVISGSGLRCQYASYPATGHPIIYGYLQAAGLGTACNGATSINNTVTLSSADPYVKYPGTPAPGCESAGRDDVKSGGFYSMLVKTTKYEKIHTPVGRLRVEPSPLSPLSIFGSIMAGRIDAPDAQNLEFVSTSAVKMGVPGIVNASDLTKFNLEVQAGGAGISVPLYSLPVVYSSKDASR